MSNQASKTVTPVLLRNVADWLMNGCDPAKAAIELRMLAHDMESASETEGYPGIAHDFERMRTALRDLVRLKDLKTEALAIETSGSWSAVHRKEAMLTEYRAKKGEAWDAARRALSPESPPKSNCHPTSAPPVKSLPSTPSEGPLTAGGAES